MGHLEHPTGQLLRPFIGLPFATATTRPALATETHAHPFPTLQADVGRKAMCRVATGHHFLYFRNLMPTDLLCVFLLVTRPIIAIAHNVLNCPRFGLCRWLVHAPSLTCLSPDRNPAPAPRFYTFLYHKKSQ